MYSGNGDPGIAPGQVWEFKSRMDGRRARIVGIDYDEGMIKLEWLKTDPERPYHETDLTNFVQRCRRVEEVPPLTAA